MQGVSILKKHIHINTIVVEYNYSKLAEVVGVTGSNEWFNGKFCGYDISLSLPQPLPINFPIILKVKWAKFHKKVPVFCFKRWKIGISVVFRNFMKTVIFFLFWGSCVHNFICILLQPLPSNSYYQVCEISSRSLNILR